MQISGPTQRLCRLLVDWPRQSLAKWLAEQSSPLDVLGTTAQPPDTWRRKTPKHTFVGDQVLPKPLRDYPYAVLGIFDSGFPAALKNIPDPPLVLFCLGNLGNFELRCVSVVGARRCTTLGKAIAQSMAAELAGHGCCIVSGLAVGVDAAAHRGALEVAREESVHGRQTKSGGGDPEPEQAKRSLGRTTAVLGSGLGCLYPKQHGSLARTLLGADGLIVTEYPADTEPRPYQFPERNRLISGLSPMTVLVEAGEQSGSLITARLALEQGRDVCAVPGSPTSPVSQGCHRLIRQGAALVTCAQEVLEELGWQSCETTQPFLESPRTNSQQTTADPRVLPADKPELSEPASDVLAALATQALQFDEILANTGSSAQQVSQCLIELQLAGFVRQGPDGYIRLP